eukprot:328746-Chlamydomonas_euryale.AAC.3
MPVASAVSLPRLRDAARSVAAGRAAPRPTAAASRGPGFNVQARVHAHRSRRRRICGDVTRHSVCRASFPSPAPALCLGLLPAWLPDWAAAAPAAGEGPGAAGARSGGMGCEQSIPVEGAEPSVSGRDSMLLPLMPKVRRRRLDGGGAGTAAAAAVATAGEVRGADACWQHRPCSRASRQGPPALVAAAAPTGPSPACFSPARVGDLPKTGRCVLYLSPVLWEGTEQKGGGGWGGERQSTGQGPAASREVRPCHGQNVERCSPHPVLTLTARFP